MWILIAVNIGFWCSCVKDTKEIATYRSKTQCEDSIKALPKSAGGSFSYICTEKL